MLYETKQQKIVRKVVGKLSICMNTRLHAAKVYKGNRSKWSSSFYDHFIPWEIGPQNPLNRKLCGLKVSAWTWFPCCESNCCSQSLWFRTFLFKEQQLGKYCGYQQLREIGYLFNDIIEKSHFELFVIKKSSCIKMF
jgi:hypothetical protein